VLLLLISLPLAQDHEFFAAYGMRPRALWAGDIGPLLSSMFLHVGPVHLAGNMLFLWVFGPRLENRLGRLRFLSLYGGSALAASLTHGLVYLDSNIPVVGASGAIAGLMGAYVLLFPLARINTFFLMRIIRVPALFYIGIWLLFQMLHAAIALSAGEPAGVAWFAHMGGFFAGIIAGAALRPPKPERLAA
jgi:membrane associated rhomboid family serine protease